MIELLVFVGFQQFPLRFSAVRFGNVHGDATTESFPIKRGIQQSFFARFFQGNQSR